MPIEFRRMTGSDATAALDERFVTAYEEIYSEPPYAGITLYGREQYLARTRAQVQRPGFELVAVEDGDHLAGFSFGYTMPAGTWWGGESTEPASPLREVDKFTVIELILRKPYRGAGTGGRLLREILAGRPEPWATLLAHPQAPARAMYDHWGWRLAGTCHPTPEAPVLDAMVRPLGTTEQ
ncbi:N-acetyltransferase [Sphaerisporangium album]|uniref:N-acetyltransferase n=1 Tax=Sphaerisporangium album TaxID=509200 RepID=UPI0011C0389A|nr:N-acetyltransferase [Sphaerisporangium album]